MAQPTYQWEVITPFANNGSKDAIPDTTEDGSVSMESGYGPLYETPPSEGGRFIKRTEWNYLINFLYNAVKELQQVITAGEFTVSASQTLTNILPISLGGTGANTVEQTKTNFGLNNVDNTSDINKPISTATQNALDGKAPMPNNISNTIGRFRSINRLNLILQDGGTWLTCRVICLPNRTVADIFVDYMAGGSSLQWGDDGEYLIYGFIWRIV